jgi:hypothetical protein
MSQKRIVKISSDGSRITFLHDDRIQEAVRPIGNITCERASNVVWNPLLQKWEVIGADGTFLSRHERRCDAIEWEIDYWQSEQEDRFPG